MKLKALMDRKVGINMVEIRAFCGVMGSGKGYECDKLIENEGYIKIDFADALRDMVWRMIEWQPETPEQYDLFKKGLIDIPGYGKLNGRLLLQKMGTEVMREQDPDFWVKQWRNSVERAISAGYNKICVSDTRFKNELNMIFSYSWKANVQVKFCNFKSERYNDDSNHESEALAKKLLYLGFQDQETIYKEILNRI